MKIVPFERSFASHDRAKYWSDKNSVQPNNIYKTTNRPYWFKCDVCGHDFEICIYSITNNNSWCHYCANRIICLDSNCTTCYNKSFASHEKVKYWSPNNSVTPREIKIGSYFKYLFICDVCNHEFSIGLNEILRGQWCSYCNGNLALCSNDECKFCFKRSFASHEKSVYFSKKNDKNPRQIFKGTRDKYMFDCYVCGHEFIKSVKSVAIANTWCPFCSNQKLCDDNNCVTCFNKSFASHEKHLQICDKSINARTIFKYSSLTKLNFMCHVCNTIFMSCVNEVSRGSWCPMCINKSEKKLLEQLQIIHANVISQYRVDWCKKIKPLPFDFCILEHKIIIELDGPQHFRQVSIWQSPEEQFINDKYKEKCANDNDFSIIRLLQEDVFRDKYNWFSELCDAINTIIQSGRVMNIYLCKNNDYDAYLE